MASNYNHCITPKNKTKLEDLTSSQSWLILKFFWETMQGNKSKKKKRKKEKETHYLLFLSGIKKSKSNNNRSTVPIYSRSFFLSLLISRYCEDTVSFQAPSIDLLLPLIKSNLLLPSSSSNSVCFPPCDS